jgi:pyruvate formate lyase activating enzyme
VAFTYNDPVIFVEYAVDVAAACHAAGIRTVAVTAGYIHPAPRAWFFRHIDAANVDLKGFSERFYQKLCAARLGEVLDTLLYLRHETRVWFEITTLLIPGENDSQRELEAMSHWVVENLGTEVPWHFSAFHPDWKMRDHPATPPGTLRRARQIAMHAGMQHVYLGNVYDEEGDTTRCATCGTPLIVRNWYDITAWNLSADGTCPACGEPLGGVFEAEPGHWGRRRLPVRLG